MDCLTFAISKTWHCIPEDLKLQQPNLRTSNITFFFWGGLKSSGMWCCVGWWMIPDAEEKCSILHLPSDPALHSRRLGCSKKDPLTVQPTKFC